MSKSIQDRALQWLFSGDTGLSSRCLCAHMLGVKAERSSYPSDPSDLGRCLRLLELIPEWKPRIGEMAAFGPGWAGQVKAWDKLAQSMADEVGIDWSKGCSAPLTYDAMKIAQADGYRSDNNYECRFDSKGHLSSASRREPSI